MTTIFNAIGEPILASTFMKDAPVAAILVAILAQLPYLIEQPYGVLVATLTAFPASASSSATRT